MVLCCANRDIGRAWFPIQEADGIEYATEILLLYQCIETVRRKCLCAHALQFSVIESNPKKIMLRCSMSMRVSLRRIGPSGLGELLA